MRAQTEAAVAQADVALFMIDARAGIVPLDEEIARWLRASDTPVIVVANKAEGKAGETGMLEAHGAGLRRSGRHCRPSMARAWSICSRRCCPFIDVEVEEEERREADAPLKLAIVGRPNAGKSTLINKMLGEDRMITGPEAGITRDSIAIDWEWTTPGAAPRQVRLIDTAGMRKRAKVQDKLEKLSVADALHAVDFAEVVVLLLDATRGLEAQDLRIADRVLRKAARSSSRSTNGTSRKWHRAVQRRQGALEEGLSQVKGVPVMTVSAATGKGIDTVAAGRVRNARGMVEAGRHGRAQPLVRTRDREANPPPAPGGKRIKLRYVTQAKTRPPSFVMFGTRVDQLPASYERYLVNAMRRDLGFGAVPVRLTFRAPKNPFD